MQNNIKSLLEKRGIKKIVPTPEQLSKWNMTIIRYNKIMDNEGEQLNARELIYLSTWLNLEIKEMLQTDEKEAVA